MIYLRCFVLVMAIIAVRHGLVSDANSQLLASNAALHSAYPDLLAATCVGFCIAGKFLAVAMAVSAEHLGPRLGPTVAWTRFERGRTWLEWLWIAAVTAALSTGQAGRWLAEAEAQGVWQCWLILLWFAPSFVFIAALELSSAQLEDDLSGQRGRTVQTRWLARMRLGATGQLLTCLIPVWILLLSGDLLQWSLPQLPDSWRLSISLCVLTVVVLLVAPLWMRWSIGARPVETGHPLCQRLDELCRLQRITAPRLMLVGNDRTWCGAALVGWAPLCQQLWLGKSLLEELSAQQLDMVLLHELAHLRRGHLWWRFIPLLLVALGLVGLLHWLPTGESSSFSWWVTAGSAVALGWLLGWVSRRCEMDADRIACLQASVSCRWTDGRPECAAQVLLSALKHLQGPASPADRGSWLHPSLHSRRRSMEVHLSA